jgi:uncharacterized membrane protein
MNVRSLIEKVRDNQFLTPALFIALSLALVTATNYLDRGGAAHPLAIASSASATRTLLATIASATITVAALVFSLSAVTMQLAATQYSPRVVQGFLRDRKQQLAFGISMGTFTYALAALATLPSATSGINRADWTATTSVALAVVTAVAIVAYIDHVIRKVRIDDTVRRLAERTESAFEPRRSQTATLDDGVTFPSDVEPVVLRSARAGYILEVDLTGLTDSLPPGAVARLDVWAGHFVTEGRRLITVWHREEVDLSATLIRIAIGDQRTIEQDPGFGIRQLVDIGLRALSPGVNDPATAADVVRHVSGCLRSAYLVGDVDRVFHGNGGARLFTPHAPSVTDFVTDAITPIRRAAADQPLVLAAISDALAGLDDELSERGIEGTSLRREIAMAQARRDQLEAADVPPQPST